MIRINYKLVRSNALHKKGYAYIKSIEGGVRDVLELSFAGIESGIILLMGREIPIVNSVASLDVKSLPDGNIAPRLMTDTLTCNAEEFVCENGFISRTSPSQSHDAEIAEAFELIEERMKESERIIKELAEFLVGHNLFEFD